MKIGLSYKTINELKNSSYLNYEFKEGSKYLILYISYEIKDNCKIYFLLYNDSQKDVCTNFLKNTKYSKLIELPKDIDDVSHYAKLIFIEIEKYFLELETKL